MLQKTVIDVLTILLLYCLDVVYVACILYVGVRTYHDHQLTSCHMHMTRGHLPVVHAYHGSVMTECFRH